MKDSNTKKKALKRRMGKKYGTKKKDQIKRVSPMVAKKHQNPSGGLNAAGRKHFKKTEGSNLKPPVKKTPPKDSKDFKRKISFAARFGAMDGPMKDEKGRPTRLCISLKSWGFGSKEAARNFANRHKA